MTQQLILKFNSRRYGEEILATCRVHGIDFAEIERGVRANWLVVPAGSMDLSKIDIGRRRVLENPSRRLDDVLCGAVHGHAYFLGKPIKEDRGDILEGLKF